MIALLNSKVKVPTREKLEMACKLRASSVNVDMVLLSDPIAPVSWVAAVMTTLKHALRSQSGTAAANATRLQMEDLVRRWGSSEDATNGFPSHGPEIPAKYVCACLADRLLRSAYVHSTSTVVQSTARRRSRAAIAARQ
jgi:hypothetical protein